MNNSKRVQTLVRCALFLALIFVVTFFVNFPLTIGNINLGDSVILVASMFLPTLPLAFAAGMGPCFADLAGGFGNYAVFTLIIKFIEGLIMGLIYHKVKVIKNVYLRFFIASLLAVIIIPVGYFFVNWFQFGLGAAAGTILNDVLQAGASLVIANILHLGLRGANLYDKD